MDYGDVTVHYRLETGLGEPSQLTGQRESFR